MTTLADKVRDRQVTAEQINVDGLPSFVLFWHVSGSNLVCHGFDMLRDNQPCEAVFDGFRHISKRENCDTLTIAS